MSHRYKTIKVKPANWKKRVTIAVALAGLALVAWATLARAFAPTANTTREHFDAIIVLGASADADGNPTPEELARVTEGVHEYERGVASHLIFTGGPERNQFVEAEVMARTASAQGIPPAAILVEPRAKDTIQNACYSARIMQARGFKTAEVVSTAYHLPRAGLIFNRLPIEWRTHAAPPLQAESSGSLSTALLETLKTIRYLTYANWAEHCNP